MAEPVAEVVLRAKVPHVVGAAEVRRLVPAVAGAGQRGDDALEVVLHRVGLPAELLSPGMGEARPRLRLELVAGQVLRLERERVAEVGFEIGGALARDPVDEIERDVVKSGITKMMHGAPDVVRTGNALEHAQQLRAEGLRAERHARDARAAQRAARAPASPSRDSPRPSPPPPAAARRAGARAPASAVNVGVPPPRKIVSSSGASSAALELELAQQRVDVGAVLAVAPDDGDEVAVAAAVRAERQVHVEMPRAAHALTRFGRGDELAAAVRADVRPSPRRRRAQNVHSYEQMTRVAVRRERRAAALAHGAHLERHQLFCPCPMLSTARNASCGTSTAPTCFIRFLPFFCFSSSLRLREMSPP